MQTVNPAATPPATAPEPAAVQTFKTQADAVQYLVMQGYKVCKSTFHGHLKQGKVATDTNGKFTASALLGYAAANLTPTARIEDTEARNTLLTQAASDADLKSVKAARERIKLAKEQGMLMPVERHEDELAARALFFKSEIESYIYRSAPKIIEVCGGDQSKVRELVAWWAESTADWMDAWSAERQFATEDIEEMDG